MVKSEAAFVEMQKQVDKLATDLKKSETSKKPDSQKTAFQEMISKNIDELAKVSKSYTFKHETKDMTLANALTGDQPRTYNNDVVVRPAALANVEDLTRPAPIDGGTYTFVRSTLASGAVTTQVEGSAKAQLEYDYAMIDANTDFIAGFAVYSRKMRNNLPFLENTLAIDLRRDYYKGENTVFSAILAAQATASTQVITGQNKVEMLIAEIATLADDDFMANGVVVRPSDYYDILITEKSTGAGLRIARRCNFRGGRVAN